MKEEDNDEELDKFFETCSTEDFQQIKAAKEIYSNFEVMNEILGALNENKIFFESPELKINNPIRSKIQLIIPDKDLINEDLNYIKDLKVFQKGYEENAGETIKTIDNIKKNFSDLSGSITSIIDVIEKIKNEYFVSVRDMMKPIITEIEKIEKLDTSKFGNQKLETFNKKKTNLDNNIKEYDKKLVKIFKELKESLNTINENIKKYIELLENLDSPVNSMIKEILEKFNDFEEKCRLFIDKIYNYKSEDEKKEGLKIFREIEKLNSKIIDLIFQHEKELKEKDTILLNKKQESENDFNKILNLDENVSKKLNDIQKDTKNIIIELNELLKFCALKTINPNVKEFKGLQIDKIKDKVMKGTDEIIVANKKIEVDVSKLRKFIQEKEKIFDSVVTLDLAFIMDITGSMSSYLEFAKKQILSIINKIMSDSNVNVKLGFIGYRDFNDNNVEYVIYPELTKEVELVKNFISSARTGGGGDCEDMAGGLYTALNYKWESKSRFAMLIADVPCHGIQYHEVPNFDTHPEGDPDPYKKIDNLIMGFAKKNINLMCLNLTELTIKLYNNFIDYYKKGKNANSNSDIFIGYFNDQPEKLAEIIVKKAKEFYEKRHENTNIE